MSLTDPGDATDAAARRFLLRRAAGNDDFSPHPSGGAGDDPAALHVAHAWDLAGCLREDPAIVELRADALAGPAGFAGETGAEPRRLSRALPYGLAAAAAIVGLIVAVPMVRQIQPAPGASIAGHGPKPGNSALVAGETSQKQIDLADGSVIRLDARSHVRVEYTDRLRQVVLLKGRAYFTVQHEHRPFKVLTPGGETLDLGTRFVVETVNGKTRVELVEGAVAVRARGSAEQIALKPGEAAGYTQTGTLIERGAVRGDPLDWTMGRLRFEDTALDEAIEKLSRYSPTAIRLDPAVRASERRITGVFFIGDSAHFAEALAGALNLGLVRETDGSERLTLR